MVLEARATESSAQGKLHFDLREDETGILQIDWRCFIADLLDAIRSGEPSETLAAAFHEAVADAFVDCAARAARKAGLSRIVLSGGCFANRLLLQKISKQLHDADFEVYSHRQVPPGDGGLALGQAVSAARRVKEKE